MLIQRAKRNAPGLVQKDGPATSKEAAALVFPRSGTQRFKVLEVLIRHPFGLTDQEIEKLIGIDYNSFGPRRRELIAADWVMDSGRVRKSRYGVHQIVWMATAEGRKEWRAHA